MKNNLELIKSTLSKEKFKAKIVDKSKLIENEHIEFVIENDYQNRPVTSYIWLDSQQMKENESANNQIIFVQMLVVLPFTFEEEAIHPLSRYLHIINKSLAFPGFGISEPDKSIYYKYTLTFTNGEIANSFLLDFIGLVLLVLDSFIERIEKISNRTSTLVESIY